MMRVFSNPRARPCSTATPSTLIEHKELRQLLEAMIRASKVCFEKTGDLPSFAMAMNDHGTLVQLGPPKQDRSPADAARFMENGLRLIAQQLTSKAVGLCAEIRPLNGSYPIGHLEVVFLLEHRDGGAYRVVIPDFLDPNHWDARRTETRFFTRTDRTLFLASTRG
jgi:hypothetical protein